MRNTFRTVMGLVLLPVLLQGGNVRGRVIGPKGRPVPGAQVFVASPSCYFGQRHAVLAEARADAQGHFRMAWKGDSPGILSAWAPGLTPMAMHLGNAKGEVQLELLRPDSGLDLKLRSPSQAGQPGRLILISDQEEPLFPTPRPWPGGVIPAGLGTVRVPLPPGKYIASLEFPGCSPQVWMAEVSGWTQNVRTLQRASTSATVDVQAWIQVNAKPIQGSDPNLPLDDLEPLRAMVGNARIVGLGEATHGTREFFQMKHRMLAFLVERMGFNIFAIEASLPNCLALNDYVLGGEGDPERLVARLEFWTWDTHEVLEMLRWIRAHNDRARPEDRVQFVGVDMQSRDVLVPMLSERLKDKLPDVAERLMSEFGNLPLDWGMSAPIPDEEAQARLRTARWILEEVQGMERKAPGASEAGILAKVLVQNISMCVASGRSAQFRVRDAAMAENAVHHLNECGPKARMVLWAHNGHVSAGEPEFWAVYTPPMGRFLRERLGADYRPVGFFFQQGGFQARGQRTFALEAFQVGPAPSNALSAAFAKTSFPSFLLDLRVLPEKRGVRSWFLQKRPDWTLGALFDEEQPKVHLVESTAPKDFDIAVFFRETTRARPLPRSVGVLDLPAGVPVPHLQNLELKGLQGWVQQHAFMEVKPDVEGGVTLSPVDPTSGGVSRLYQTLDATRYRGNTITWIARGTAGSSSWITTWIRVERKNGTRPTVHTGNADPRNGEPPTASCKVPKDAERVTVGVTIQGATPILLKSFEFNQKVAS